MDLVSTMSLALGLDNDVCLEQCHLESDNSDSSHKLVYESSLAEPAGVR